MAKSEGGGERRGRKTRPPSGKEEKDEGRSWMDAGERKEKKGKKRKETNIQQKSSRKTKWIKQSVKQASNDPLVHLHMQPSIRLLKFRSAFPPISSFVWLLSTASKAANHHHHHRRRRRHPLIPFSSSLSMSTRGGLSRIDASAFSSVNNDEAKYSERQWMKTKKQNKDKDAKTNDKNKKKKRKKEDDGNNGLGLSVRSITMRHNIRRDSEWSLKGKKKKEGKEY